MGVRVGDSQAPTMGMNMWPLSGQSEDLIPLATVIGSGKAGKQAWPILGLFSCCNGSIWDCLGTSHLPHREKPPKKTETKSRHHVSLKSQRCLNPAALLNFPVILSQKIKFVYPKWVRVESLFICKQKWQDQIYLQVCKLTQPNLSLQHYQAVLHIRSLLQLGVGSDHMSSHLK